MSKRDGGQIDKNASDKHLTPAVSDTQITVQRLNSNLVWTHPTKATEPDRQPTRQDACHQRVFRHNRTVPQETSESILYHSDVKECLWARARARVRACVRACVCVCVLEIEGCMTKRQSTIIHSQSSNIKLISISRVGLLLCSGLENPDQRHCSINYLLPRLE